MTLIRLYAQDLRYPDKAQKVLRTLEKRPHVPRGHTDFARRSIQEWSQGGSEPEPERVLPESIDGCWRRSPRHRRQRLEQKTAEQPEDFHLWMRLARVHVSFAQREQRGTCRQTDQANPAFKPEQIQTAKTRLAEWLKAASASGIEAA